MKLIFIDETSDSEKKSFLGVCFCIIDLDFYRGLKEEVSGLLKNSDWDMSKEFKGSYLFSASNGDSKVSVDKRIEIAYELIKKSSGAHNSKLATVFVYNTKGNNFENYKSLVSFGLEKIISLGGFPANQKKRIASIFIDNRSDIDEVSGNRKELLEMIGSILKEKKIALVEDVEIVRSSLSRPGIIHADLLAYSIGRFVVLDLPKPEYFDTDNRFKKIMNSLIICANQKKFKLYCNKIEIKKVQDLFKQIREAPEKNEIVHKISLN
jgi:hypothetical protein